MERGWLVRHEEVHPQDGESEHAWRVLLPEQVPFVSYAPEWCFSQLKDAALTVLAIQQEALAHGMMLKDAPAANMQFLRGRPVLIDTLSFVAADRAVWPAYFQFCKHFVAPLLLAAYRGAWCLRFAATVKDGIPLEQATALLPRRSWGSPLALWHVHLHARANSRAGASAPASSSGGGRQNVLLDSLRRGIGGLRWAPEKTEWSTYEDDRPTYSPEAWSAKLACVGRVVERLKPRVVWDLGMASGHISRIAAASGAFTVGFDADPSSVERAYLEARSRGETRFLPLVQDLLRPTGPGGWAERETLGLTQRGPADLVMALGLTHHLAVRGGVPFSLQLEHFGRLGRAVLVELIPSTDPVVRAWSGRFDLRNVTRQDFEAGIPPTLAIAETMPIPSSERVLYLLQPD